MVDVYRYEGARASEVKKLKDEALCGRDRLVLGGCNAGGAIAGQEDRQAGV